MSDCPQPTVTRKKRKKGNIFVSYVFANERLKSAKHSQTMATRMRWSDAFVLSYEEDSICRRVPLTSDGALNATVAFRILWSHPTIQRAIQFPTFSLITNQCFTGHIKKTNKKKKRLYAQAKHSEIKKKRHRQRPNRRTPVHR